MSARTLSRLFPGPRLRGPLMEASVPGLPISWPIGLAHLWRRAQGGSVPPGSAWPRTLVWAIRDVLAIGALMHHGRLRARPRCGPHLYEEHHIFKINF